MVIRRVAMAAVVLTSVFAFGVLSATAQTTSRDGTEEEFTDGYKGLPGAVNPGKPTEDNGWTPFQLKVVPVQQWNFRTPNDRNEGDRRAAKGNWIAVNAGVLPITGVSGGPVRYEYADNKLMLDVDGDGRCETPHPREHFALKALRPDGTSGPYHFRLRRIDKDYLFTRACMAVGKIGKTKVAFIDENNNSTFNDDQQDAIIIGKRPAAQLLSAVINVDNELYHVRVNASGTQGLYKAYEGPQGTLDLVGEYKGKTRPLYVMLRQGGVIMDAARKDTVVPHGTWNLFDGMVGRSVHQSATIQAGTLKPLVVKEGETTSLAWGMPGKITFTCTKVGNKLTIHTSSIQIWGQAGEQYTNFKPKKFTPDAQVVDTRTGKQIYRGNMGAGC